MAIYTEARGKADFLVSEANGMYRSREEKTVNATVGELVVGTILSETADVFGGVAVDGTPAGILWETVPEGETVQRTVVVRDAEVHAAALTYPDGATDAQKGAINDGLNALGIILRN
jgi:hypothetical protein